MKSQRTILWVTVATTIGVTGLLHGQRPPDPVDFRPFSDGRNWIVKEPLTYQVGVSNDSATVPRGFVTDLASIPPALQSLIQQNGPHLLPAVIHDYLYWKQTCTRDQSDQLMLLAMIENQVPLIDQTAIHGAVRAAGGFAWDQNARERKARQIRILPESHINILARTLWPEYRALLMMNGIMDGPDTSIPSGFCARGSMTTKAALETR